MKGSWFSRRGSPRQVLLLFLLLVVSPLLFSSGCELLEFWNAFSRAQEGRGIAEENQCRIAQQMLGMAQEELQARYPRQAANLPIGGPEWMRFLEKNNLLMMPVTCPAVMGGSLPPGHFYRAKDGTLACRVHGALVHSDFRRMSEYKTDAEEAADFVQEQVDSGNVPLWLMGLAGVLALAAAWIHLGAEEEAEIVALLRGRKATPAGEVHPGAPCLVEGTAVCETPLLAPRVREPVVYYEYLQVEEWEVQDRNGFWNREEKVLKEESEGVAFFVEDTSGKIPVAPGGARFETRQLQRDQVGTQGTDGDIGGRGQGLTGKYRNHRWVHLVRGIPVGCPTMVLGTPVLGPDEIPGFETRKARGQEEPPLFLISCLGREEVLERYRDNTAVRRLLTGTFGVLAALAMLVGLLLPS